MFYVFYEQVKYIISIVKAVSNIVFNGNVNHSPHNYIIFVETFNNWDLFG